VNIDIDEEESSHNDLRAASRARAQEFNDMIVADNREQQTK
jgi:hypothetical protein